MSLTDHAMTTWNPDLYKRALDFAAKAHGDQKVPGSGVPYVVHLTKVCMEVLRDGAGNIDLAMQCALLHDTVEDTATTLDDLRATFGDAVAAGVGALTKDGSIPKEQAMTDSLSRIRQQPMDVWKVKLADRITNLEPAPPAWSLEKRQKYVTEATHILEALKGASGQLEARLAAKISEYRRAVEDDLRRASTTKSSP